MPKLTSTDQQADDLKITESKVYTVKFTELKKLCNFPRSFRIFENREHNFLWLALKSLMHQYRWELFKTYAGYSIVINGYGHFKEVKVQDTGETFGAEYIFRTLAPLVKE